MSDQKESGMEEFFIVMALILVGAGVIFAIYGMAESGHKFSQQQRQIENDKMKYFREQNCRVTGFYGNTGQKKSYTCDDGKVWREEELL